MSKPSETYNVAIVYHYLAHYRLPVFRRLMQSNQFQFELISDKRSKIGIKTIDSNLAKLPIDEGGLRWNFVRNSWIYKEAVIWQNGICKLLRKGDYDAVIFLGNAYFISTWFAIIFLRFKKKKVYLWTHGVTNSDTSLKWKFKKLFYNLADGLLLYGQNAKHVMQSNGFPKEKMTVIYNSLDHAKQIELRERLDEGTIQGVRRNLFVKPDIPVLVFVGRLTRQKQLHMIPEAVSYLKSWGFEVNTLFIGPGKQKVALEELYAKYNLQEYVHFYGPCYEETILSELIGSSDICVSPGEVGLTALTALGYGTPVISHDDFNHQMPEYETIIPGENGYLFKYGSTEDLALKIRKWITNPNHKDRKSIREKCFQIIDEVYNPENQTRIIEKTLSKGLREHHP